MKRIHLFFLVWLLILAGKPVAGQKVSIGDAVKIAGRHMSALSSASTASTTSATSSASTTSTSSTTSTTSTTSTGDLKSPGAASRHRFSLTATAVRGTDTLYYVLNDSLNNDFVILAADRRCWPVLGYSTAAIFPVASTPEPFTKWMEDREEEISYILNNVTTPDAKTTQQWEALESSASAATTGSVIVGPLLSTTWNQGCYYNTLCPEDPAGPCGHVWAGCVATATAQIMKFWNFPTTGTGAESYVSPYGPLSADFGATTYLWSQMPDHLTAENEAVATLMLHLGVAVNMDYSPTGSGAGSPRDALVNYFRYSPMARYLSREDYSDAGWAGVIRAELDNLRPLYYSGSSDLNPGHAFVCDGYDDAGYFHFNWGWGGAADGYFFPNQLTPGGMDFSYYQGALIQIIPTELPVGYQGLFLSANDIILGAFGGGDSVTVVSSASWSATTNQPWLSVSPASGNAGATNLLISAPENPGTTDRTALVTISAPGFAPHTITVLQPASITISPGGLKSALPEDPETVFHLSLLGSIDARDFRTMRDELSNLASIDLSRVSIAAYNGTEGTAGSQYVAYPQGEIPRNAFYNGVTHVAEPNLVSLVLPATATAIGDNAFNACFGLKKMTIPPLVTTIGSGAFGNCWGLKSIFVPASVTSIALLTFMNQTGLITVDPGNPNYSSREGLLYNKDKSLLMTCPISKTGRLVLPQGVTQIANYALQQCDELTEVVLPSSLQSIGEKAFLYCESLVGMHLPASVVSIGNMALAGLGGPITVEDQNPQFSASAGVLFNKSQSLLIQCPRSVAGDYSPPATVTDIMTYAFFNCTSLQSVSLPPLVATIGDFAFAYCLRLATVTLPSSLKTLGKGAFYGCQALSAVSLPASVTILEANLFANCQGLTSVQLPQQLTFIGESAFSGALKLSSITLPPSVNTIQGMAFSGCKGLTTITPLMVTPVNLAASPGVFDQVSTTACKLVVPFGASSLYRAANQWGDFSLIEEAPGLFLSPGNVDMVAGRDTAIIKLASSAAWALSSDQSWLTATPASGTPGVRELPVMADSFSQSGQRSGKITVTATGFDPQTITVVQYGATPVTPGNLKSLLGDKLATIAVLVLTGSIDARDFRTMRDEMPYLSRADLSGVSIAAYSGTEGTFQGNNLTYPANAIPQYAFFKPGSIIGKVSLRRIDLPATVTTIGKYAFQSCTSLAEVLLPASLTSIETSAFYGCQGMAAISIPAAVKTIAREAFFRFSGNILVDPANSTYSDLMGVLMNKKKSVLIQCPTSKSGPFVVPATVVTIGEKAFESCLNLTTLEIPASVTSIGTYAFGFCSGLREVKSHAPQPVDLSGSVNVFSGLNFPVCTLKVPAGTASLYAAASQWRDFTSVEEMAGLFVSPSCLSLGAPGGTASLTLAATTTWSASSDQPWLSLLPVSGTPGVSTLLISVEPLSTAGDRTASLTFSSSGFSPVTVVVSQFGSIEVVAGTLRDILASSLASITHLKLSGTIDARDFVTMRDEMPMLQSIDLTDVSIVQYQGTGGTYGTESRLYPTNTIPERAFFNYATMMAKTGLKTFLFPSLTSTIGTLAFNACSGLTEVRFPESLISIGGSAFSNCTGLSEVAIPSQVNYIGSYAFSYCSALKTVEAFPMVPVPLSEALNIVNVFIGVAGTGCLLRVPYGTLAAYQLAEQWRDFLAVEEMSGIFLSANTLTFGANTATKEVELSCSNPWSFTADQPWISASPASGVPGKYKITISVLDNPAASSRQTWMTISATGLSSRNIDVFQYGLTEVSAGHLADLPASFLDTVTFLTLQGEIDARDFKTMRDLMPRLSHLDLSRASIVAYTGSEGTLPASQAYLANQLPPYSFYNSQTGTAKTGLATVLLPVTVTSVGNYAFAYCSGLLAMELPSQLVTIGHSAFMVCAALTRLSLPSALQSIGINAFAYCSKLQSIYAFPISPVDVSTNINLFYRVSLTGALLYVPFGSRNAYLGAPVWKEFLNIVEMEGVFVSATAFDVGANAGSRELVVASGFPWSVAAGHSWVSVTPPSGGAGQHSLLLQVEANEGAEARTTVLTISAEGQPPCFVTVRQSARVVVSAGTLRELLLDQLSSLTSLTLAGTIDARDVRVMRDEMPLLADLDLRDAVIVEYTGTEGTAGDAEISYPALTFPASGFFNPNLWTGKTSLSRVVLPATLVRIDDSGFCSCTGLQEILFPAGLTSIGNDAFVQCSRLSSLALPDQLISIGNNAFAQCSGLTGVTLSAGLTTIGYGAFESCSLLSAIFLPANVVSIGERAFNFCGALFTVDGDNPAFSAAGGILYNKNQTLLVQCPMSLSGDLVLPGTLISIGNWAFYRCSLLASVALPGTLKSIGDYAFWGCTAMKSIGLPKDLQSLGMYAFYDCSGLVAVYSYGLDPLLLDVNSYVFYGVDHTTAILYVPFGSAAAYQSALQWQEFENIVEMQGLFFSPGTELFAARGGTREILVSSGVAWTAVSSVPWLSLKPASGGPGKRVLLLTAASNVTDAVRTATVTLSAPGCDDGTIAVSQFPKFEVTAGNLETLLAGSLGSITHLSLSGSIDARDVRVMRDEMPMLEFLDLEETTIVEYAGTEGTYSGVEMTYPPLTFPCYGFLNPLTWVGNTVLREVIFPGTMTRIDYYCFSYCTALTAVTFGPSLVSIGNGAFSNCRALRKVEFPASLVSIEGGVFENCEALTGVTLPGGLISLGYYAFGWCQNLESFSIPASVTEIGSNALAGCEALKSIYAWPEPPVNLTSSPGVFDGVDTTTCILYVPPVALEAYQTALQWRDFWNIKAIPPVAPLTLELSAGWNIISMHTLPDNRDALAFFQPLITAGTLLTVLDEAGHSLADTGLLGSVSSVADSGDPVDLATPVTLKVSRAPGPVTTGADSGDPVDQATPVTLKVSRVPGPVSSVTDSGDPVDQATPVTLKVSRVPGPVSSVVDSGDRVTLGDPGTWSNSIGELMFTEGYKVRVSSSCSLPVYGTPAPLPLGIPLSEGWNIIAFPLTSAVDARVVVQELIDRGTLLKVQDENGHSLENRGVFGGWHNSIGSFLPGKGYRIRVTAPEVLTIRSTY